MIQDLKRQLNAPQLRVATETNGPLLVLAGAGSGKTRSIIYRCAYLIKELNVPPWNILVVTFTNKAARELQDRLEKLLGYPVRNLWVGTFHSVCSRILRFESVHLPFSSNFSIYDDDAQKSLLKKIYKENGYDTQKLPINRVLGRIGKYKNRLLLPEDLVDSGDTAFGSISNWKSFLGIYKLYQQHLLLNQALDFDDILLYCAQLLKMNESIRSKYSEMFRHVMIDEYQDTNQAQFEIVFQICREHQRVCVVGDDDQAIYSFRGATIRNILEFEKDFPNVQSIRLEQNYRSTMSILNLANAIIHNNRRRHVKDLWSDRGEGHKPVLNIYENETEEAGKIADKLIALMQEGVSLNDIAILYRTNAQSRVFEYALMQRKLPHSIVGSLHFYQRQEIRDLLAYLAAISNPADSESLLRIINEPPRGIGQTSVNRLIAYAAKVRININQAMQNVHSIQDLGSPAKTKITAFAAKLDNWRVAAKTTSVLDIVKDVLDDLNLIAQYRKGNDPKEIARAENLIEFVSSVSEFTERFVEDNDRKPLLNDFLPFVALQTDMDRVNEKQESVRLMTLHNAKGLEFAHVFIAGLEDELLPHRMSMDSREEIEEERRLFYVGVTRAKDILYLSYARFRRLYDTFSVTKPSQFIRELDANLFSGSKDTADFVPAPRNRPKKKVTITDSQKHYRIGQLVWHDEYGTGTILNVDGTGEDARLTISFQSGKLTKILGNYVRTARPAD